MDGKSMGMRGEKADEISHENGEREHKPRTSTRGPQSPKGRGASEGYLRASRRCPGWPRCRPDVDVGAPRASGVRVPRRPGCTNTSGRAPGSARTRRGCPMSRPGAEVARCATCRETNTKTPDAPRRLRNGNAVHPRDRPMFDVHGARSTGTRRESVAVMPQPRRGAVGTTATGPGVA